MQAVESPSATASDPGVVRRQQVDGTRPGRARRALLLGAAPRGGSGAPWRLFLLGGGAILATLAVTEVPGWVMVAVRDGPPAIAEGPFERAVARAANAELIGVGEAAAATRPEAPAPDAANPAGSRHLAAEIAGIGRRVDGLWLMTSATMLADAARDSRPFIAELALAIETAGGDPALLDPLDRLMPWAETGAATVDELARQFDGVARRAALLDAQSVGWMTWGVRLFTRDLPRTLGVGESEADRRRLERASAAVARGALDEAVRELTAVEEPAIGIVRPWVANVTARMTVDDETRRFRRAVLRRALGTTG